MVRQAHHKLVRVRIAPSPTGFAHVGTAYTAIFNYAFARKNSGTFIVRLEDTDQKRNVKGADTAIVEGLSWLGLTWDEGFDKGGPFAPYKQSERLEIYRERAKDLIKSGLAYEEEGAIRFKNPGEDIGWEDLIRSKISFPGGEVTDFVILKSDGFPTYNFGVVIDDILMQITHVIRGEEHISNTPRQIALYKAFGVDPPVFAHHPTLRNAERKKLSKRRDPVDLRIFKEKGYLPEALVNFLCLLGWSHPEEKEIFDLEEFVNLFDFSRVKPAGPIFDTAKLDWINGEYIRKLSIESLNSKFKIQNSKFAGFGEEKQLAITELVRERIKKISDFDSFAGFFFEEPKVDKKLFGKNYREHLFAAIEAIEQDKPLDSVPKVKGYKVGDFFMDLRIAITGSKFTPPINESIVILGKEETLKRLKGI